MEIKTIVPINSRQEQSEIELFPLKKMQSHDWRKMLSGLGIAVSLLFIVLLGKSLHQIENKVKAMPRFSINREKLAIKQLPKWLQSFTKTIAPLSLPLQINIFTPGLTTTVANAYLRNPWVEKVKSVVKEYPNNIYVRLLLRRPRAIVKVNEMYFLVDATAIRLPGRYGNIPQTTYPLPMIKGTTVNIPVAGKKWQDPYLKNSLQLISFLLKNRVQKFLPKIEIQIEDSGQKYKQLILLTENKRRIIWGRAFTSEFPMVTPQQRLQSLQKLYTLVVTDKNFEVDLRFGNLIIRKLSRKNFRRF